MERTEVIFLGTGTSSQLPLIPCLTVDNPTCQGCLSGAKPGSKDRRRNTSLLIIHHRADGSRANILIDCGKSFYDSALEFFPRFGVHKIDAVILTHDHADAIFGLDDLRMWTHHSATSIDIYLSEETMHSLQSRFEYLTNIAASTGGGGVPALNYHVFPKNLPAFNVAGIEFLPLKVLHGKSYYALGYRFQNVSYISDVVQIPQEARSRIENSHTIIIDSLYSLKFCTMSVQKNNSRFFPPQKPRNIQVTLVLKKLWKK